jgi:hypothetical protein
MFSKINNYSKRTIEQIDRELSPNIRKISELSPKVFDKMGTLSNFINGEEPDPNIDNAKIEDDNFYVSSLLNGAGFITNAGLTGISKLPFQKIKNISGGLGKAGGFISGGLNIVGDITDMVQGRDKNAVDYAKSIGDIAVSVASMPFIKDIPGVGGVAGLATDGIRIAELAKNKSKNPLYWGEVGVDVVSNVVSEIPVFGTALAPIGYAFGGLLHILGNVVEEGNKSWEGQQWDIERKLIDQKNDRLKFEADQRTRIEKARIAREKENEKKITTLEDSHLPRMLNQVDYNTENDYKNALYNYVNLVHQGKMKDINVNDINWMKGQIITDSHGYSQTLHDFIVNNDFNKAFDEMKHSNVQIDSNYNKIRNHTSVFKVRDKILAQQQKWTSGDQGSLDGIDLQRRNDNTTPPWDNSNEAIQYYKPPTIEHPGVYSARKLQHLAFSPHK